MPAANGYRAENNRPSAAKRGYGHGWRQLRASFLEENPECSCGAKATVVDHKRTMDSGGHPTSKRNLQAMCHSCHSRKTATKNRERTNAWESKMQESTPNAQRLINQRLNEGATYKPAKDNTDVGATLEFMSQALLRLLIDNQVNGFPMWRYRGTTEGTNTASISFLGKNGAGAGLTVDRLSGGKYRFRIVISSPRRKSYGDDITASGFESYRASGQDNWDIEAWDYFRKYAEEFGSTLALT